MSSDSLSVRLALRSDMPAFCEVVNHYIVNTCVNFRADPQSADEWEADWRRYQASHPWLVAEQAGATVGVAYAAPWNQRRAYAWSAETTVYVRHDQLGAGVGARLYSRLLQLLDAQGYRTAVGVIALPNPRSVALHERFAFKRAGVLERVGFKFGAYHDVGLWQRTNAGSEAPPAPLRPTADVWS